MCISVCLCERSVSPCEDTEMKCLSEAMCLAVSTENKVCFPVFLSVCCQSKGKYEVIAGTLKSPDELVEVYESLIKKYPAICALIDPFRKEVRLVIM